MKENLAASPQLWDINILGVTRTLYEYKLFITFSSTLMLDVINFKSMLDSLLNKKQKLIWIFKMMLIIGFIDSLIKNNKR